MDDNVFDIGVGTGVDNKNLKKGLTDAKKQVTNFASEASKSLAGVDFTKLLVPTAIAGASIAALTKLKGALDDMAAAWREQEVAEVALTNAARNNPYLNDRAVKQLNNFANEMQRVTGLDSVMVTQTQTRLASLGRNQQQIQNILKVAADVAASGVMSFDEAVNELNNSLNGTVRTAGRLYPELKGLSKEALASGQAIEIIGQKVSGQAARAMETGTGSVTAYKNAVQDLKKLYGENWENATRGFRIAITNLINQIVDAKRVSKELKAALDEIRSGTGATSDFLTVEKNALDELYDKQRKYQEIVNDPRYASRYNITVNQAREGIRTIDEQIKRQEELVNKLNERLDIENSITEAVERANKAASTVDNLLVIEAQNKALNAQLSAQKMLETGNREAAKAARDRALEAAAAAEAEVKRIQLIKESTQKAKETREEIEKALAIEIEKIERKAMLEGKSVDSLEIQRQILDAQTSAYEKILEATRDILDNAPEEKRNLETRLELLRQEFERQRELAKTDEERKKALQELAKMQDDIQSDVTRIKNLAEEAELQEKLTELRKKSITDAVEFEQNYRRQQREVEYDNERQKLIDTFDLAIQSTQLTEDEKERLIKEYLERKKQLEENFANENLIIEKENVKAIEQAHVEMYQRLLSAAQMYLDAASSIASSISTIWTNNIDYETNEKLRANDKLVQSDEERAEAEKRIQIEAANERYKAELFAWSANVIMAQANMAKAVLDAYVAGMSTVNPMSPAIAAANMALATLIGGMQVAAVMSARPRPPRFHTGGVVEGSGEQRAVLMGGEVVQTQRQFQNTMQAISNLASIKTGNGGVQMNVTVENNASGQVTATPQITADGLKIVVEQIVQDSLANGRMDQALAQQHANLQGASFT